MNENQNEMNFSTAQNESPSNGAYYSTQPQYNNPSGYSKPPKKKGSAGKVIAIIAAVAVVGAASGFGGSYVANTLLIQDRPAATEPADTDGAEDEPEEEAATTTEYVKPAVEVDDSLSTLENTADMGSTELTLEQLYEKTSGSIVVVNNYQKTSSGYGSGSSSGAVELYGTGSGIVITSDGFIITNAHVVSGASKVSVVLYSGTDDEHEVEAVLVGSDSATDLAVLKISDTEKVVPVALGDSDSLKVGQQVCAIGNPSGLTNTLTDGIISGLNRYYSADSGYELSSIQTTTAINPGNSGGALFDMYGNVIGVVNSKLVSDSIEGLGFAITINEAKPVISDLINYGYVTGRPVLGIITTEVNEYTAYLYGLPSAGILVTSIDEDAPVAKSGLRIGDVIVAIDGKETTTVSGVQSVLKTKQAGDTVTVTVVRTVQSQSHFGYGYSNTDSTETVEIQVVLTENKG